MKKSHLLGAVCACFFIFLSTATSAAGVILGQTTWTAGNGHDYAIVEFPNETWESASMDITTTLPGYHLATITSQSEQDFIYQFFLDTTGGGWDWWLGGFQPVDPEIDPAEGWEWVTGEPWIYTNWSGGEPNDAGGIEDYLAMESWGAWNDCCTIGPGRVGGGYIAERTVIPLPPAVWLFGSGLLGLVGVARKKST
jgi:hypothetical protein